MDGGLCYTSIGNHEIRRYDPQIGNVTTVHRVTGASNGLVLDAQGRLYACEQTRRGIACYVVNGTWTTLVEHFEGRQLNSPNYLVLRVSAHPT